VYRGSIEIIVVDDGSMDNTYSIGRIFRMSTESRSVKIVHKNNGGKASALKTGIEKASGKILIMTDGDSGMDRNAVSNIVNTFRRYPDAAIVGGFVSVKNTHSGYLTVLQQLEYMITQHLIRTNQNDDGSVLIAPGPIFGIRGDIAKLYPPLDRTLVEDCDLTMSVLPSGYTTRSTHRSVSNTNAPETWRDWFRQRKRWIYGQFQAWRENKWHLRRNPWGLFTYFTWVSTSLSSMLLLGTLMVSAFLIGYGSSYYALFEFISVRTFLIFSIYLLTRGLILLSYPQSRKYIHYLPLKVLYDLVNGFLTTYLYIRYITETGVRMSWGHRSEVVH
jgi:cellulose synthase/poly-beta-1,6-N-acetylglucosamine synthase-like glycosyltransferase